MTNKYPYLTDRLLSRKPSEFAISAVTVFELEYGAEKSGWGEKKQAKVRYISFSVQYFTIYFRGCVFRR